jgi:hypothetical protein
MHVVAASAVGLAADVEVGGVHRARAVTLRIADAGGEAAVYLRAAFSPVAALSCASTIALPAGAAGDIASTGCVGTCNCKGAAGCVDGTDCAHARLAQATLEKGR